jgi:hypothetical protein
MKGRLFLVASIACGVMMQAFFMSASAQPANDPTPAPDTATTTGKNPPSSADTTAANENKPVHALYSGTGYGSNMVYLGTTMSQDNGFGYSSLSYGLKDKLYLSATGYTISGFSPYLAFYSLGLSFNHALNSWFDISTGISQYGVAETLRDTLFSNFTYADATLGLDWRILYSKISLGGLFSEGGQFYLQTRHSRYFETPSFAGDKAFFSFDPYVNILFGKMITIETTEGPATTVSPGYRPWQIRTPGPSTTYTESFGAMEIDFGLPIAFSYDFFTLEIEPGYIVPFYSETGTTGMKGFLFIISAFFRIF